MGVQNVMKYYLFDFDGTLCDTREGVLKSVLYAMDKMNIKCPLEYSEMDQVFVGPPLTVSFPDYFGDEASVLKAIGLFRERYNTEGVHENRLFDGVPGMLDELKRRGRVMYIASSKPEAFIHMILKQHGIAELFSGVYAPSLDEDKTTKLDVIKLALADIARSDKDATVYMIGDRKFDVIGAHMAGLECIGVKWGCAAENELEENGAEYVVESIEDLLKLDERL